MLRTLLLVLAVGATQEGLSRKAQALVGAVIEEVIVEDLDSEAARAGLETQRLETLVELRLRREGFLSSGASGSYVYVNLNFLPYRSTPQTTGCVYSIEVSFNEFVRLRGKSLPVATWRGSILGFRGQTSDCKTRVESSLNELLDSFVNDYLAANPKKR